MCIIIPVHYAVHVPGPMNVHLTKGAINDTLVPFMSGTGKGQSKKETVLVISDLQIPFQHPDAFKFLAAVKEKYKPTQVVCIGDEVDFHALSDFHTDPDGLSAGDELKASILELKKLYKLFPNVKCCYSNHTSRIMRKAFKSGIPVAFLKSYAEFLEAPQGWEWQEFWVIDDVRYEHGHAMSGGAAGVLNTACIKNQRSTVFGHFHTGAGIRYISTPESLLFSFNVGSLIDRHSYAFNYSQAAKTRPVLGLGIVDKGIPIFVPMLLAKGGRWVGKLTG